MSVNAITGVVAALLGAARQPAAPTGNTASHRTTTCRYTIASTRGAPPGRDEKGPAAWSAGRAWVLNDENNDGLPVSDADAGSMGHTCAMLAGAFPATSAYSTRATCPASATCDQRPDRLASGSNCHTSNAPRLHHSCIDRAGRFGRAQGSHRYAVTIVALRNSAQAEQPANDASPASNDQPLLAAFSCKAGSVVPCPAGVPWRKHGSMVSARRGTACALAAGKRGGQQ